jgi:hypothetical protein
LKRGRGDTNCLCAIPRANCFCAASYDPWRVRVTARICRANLSPTSISRVPLPRRSGRFGNARAALRSIVKAVFQWHRLVP